MIFQKLSGAGNTFGVIAESDALGALLKTTSRPELARQVCATLKSDGMLILKKESANEYRWDFFNNDGSHAEMCGNAARCAGRFAHQFMNVPQSQDILFHTVAGDVRVRHQGGDIYVAEMTTAKMLDENLEISLNGKTYRGAWIDSGVPHFVVEVQTLSDLSKETCRALRVHEKFGPRGANVTLLIIHSATSGDAVTYERGVEDFTLACGTGAVAAARALSKGNPGLYQIKMPGGQLAVDLSNAKPLLIGPAISVGSCEVSKELSR